MAKSSDASNNGKVEEPDPIKNEPDNTKEVREGKLEMKEVVERREDRKWEAQRARGFSRPSTEVENLRRLKEAHGY